MKNQSAQWWKQEKNKHGVLCVNAQSPRLSEADGGRFSNFIKETRPFLKQQHYFQSPLGDGVSLQDDRHQFKYRVPG